METSQRYFIPPEKRDLAKKLHIPVGVPLQILHVGSPFVSFERGDTLERVRIEVLDCLYLRKDRRNPFSETVSTPRAKEIQAALRGAFQSPHSPPKNPFRSTDDYVDAHRISIQSMSRTCPSDLTDDVLRQEMIERATLVVRVLKYLLFPNVSSLLQYFQARIPHDIFDRHCRNEQWGFLFEHRDNSLADSYQMASGSYTYAEFFSCFLREIFLKGLREEIDRKKKVFQDSKGLWNSVLLTREEILLIRRQIMPFIQQLFTILRK